MILILPEFLIEVLEEMMKLPVDKRDEFLREQVKLGKAEYIGSTNLTAPELATEFIKKGIKAQSIGFKKEKDDTKS